MRKRLQREVSLLLVIVMFFVMALPVEALAEGNTTQIKFQRVEPPIFNPHAGETAKILWNFQYQHRTKIEVWNGTNLACYIISPENPQTFPGSFVTNEYTWDGTDEDGEILPNGTYTIVIDSVDDDWSGKYPSVTKVTIMDSISEDIAISPNVNGHYFTVYGAAEDDMTESISVYINGNYTGDADIKSGMWTLDVELPEYKKVKITATKTNMVPKETVDEQGNPIIIYEPEEIELGPINVLKHTIRPYDKLPKIAEYYYGDSAAYTDIIEDNKLTKPYVLEIGANLLIFDPDQEGEPPISEFVDPNKMDEKCGVVDLISGSTEFSEDPVNLATGNFIYSYQDISIEGSYPISFNRFYNSRDRYNGDLGMNWHHNWEYRLQDMGDGTVKIIFSDGHRESYLLKENGEYESPAGIYRKLEKHHNQTYTLTMENSWEYNFNERGELTSIIDSNNNTTELIYEDMLLSQIKNDSGYLLIQYYKNGQIRKISDNTGRYVAYTYDGYDLKTYRDPEGNIIEYQYDEEYRMTGITSPLKDGNVTNVFDDKGRVIEQTLADGSTMYFVYDEENRTTTLTERDGSQIAYRYDENYRITEIIYPDGTEKMTFNEKGERTSYTDKNGNTYIYEYDNYGNIELVIDPMGNKTRYTYENHKVTSVTNPDGKVYSYEYDNKGNLRKTIDPLNRTIEMQYNNKGLPEKIVQPDGSFIKMEYYHNGNVKATVDPLGNRIEYEYDELNRVETIIDPRGNPTSFKYTNTSKIKEVIDAEGNSNTFVYDKNGKLREVWDQNENLTEYRYNEADQLVEIINPLKEKTQFEYDKKGNVIKSIDANNNVTTYEYDTLDRLISVTDPEQYTYKYEYDSNGNIAAATDPKGNITEYEYDQLNRVISITDANREVTKYEYNLTGKIKRITNPLNYTTEYEYYDDGQVKTVKDAKGNITSFTYNQLGLLETITDAEGAVTKYEYDSLGNIKKLIDAEGSVTSWEYDENGNVTEVKDPLGNVTSYSYDKLNRVETIEDALGHEKTFEYTKLGQVASVIDENGNVTEYKYDALGNLIEVIDAKGHSTEYVYDEVGNLVEIHQYRAIDEETLDVIATSGLITNELNNETQTVSEEVYSDAAIENQIQYEEADQTVAQAVYNEYIYAGIQYQPTYFTYDKRGLLTQVEDAEGNVEIYEYDANGNLIKEIDRDGYITTYGYDPLNLVKMINYNGEKQVEYKYNPLGQLIEMKDWLGTTSMELDTLGRILKVTDFENKNTEYAWTSTGQKESITYSDGSKVSYGYDKLGRMTQVEDAYGEITTYKYNELGNLVERVLPNGSKTEYEYNAISLITQLAEFNSTGKRTDIFRYEYDKAGNRINTYKDRYELDEEAEKWEEREETSYRYDALNQLIGVTTSNNETRKYFYDTLGNRVRKEEWDNTQIQEAVNYEYDKLNRLIRTFEGVEEGKNYRYDNRGNLTQIRSGGKIFNKYEYDETNKLVKVISKHNEQTEYTYDGFGNRIKTIIDLNHPGGGNRPDKDKNGNNGNAYGHDKDNPGNAYGHDKDKGNPKPGWNHQNKRNYMEQNFIVDITSPYNNVLMIYGDHYQTQRYTYGIDRISMDMWMLEDKDNGWIPDERGTHLSETPERLYYLQDELGSTTKVIAEDGKTSAHYNYDEFGKPLSFKKFDQNWPGPDNTFGYTGYQYDVSSELYYAQARYYMAETGRFTSEDPWKGTIIDPKTLNPYPYVQNNPLKYIDPTGMVIEMIPGGEGPSRVTTKTSSPNIVNEVRKEVVGKEVNNTSEWNCRILTEGTGKDENKYPSKSYLNGLIIVYTDPNNRPTNYDENGYNPDIDVISGASTSIGDGMVEVVEEVIINLAGFVVGNKSDVISRAENKGFTGGESRTIGNTKIRSQKVRVDIEYPTGDSIGNLHVQIKGKGGKQKIFIESLDDLDNLPKAIRKDINIQKWVEKGLELLKKLR